MEYSYTTSSYYIYPSAISYGKNSNQAGSFENKVEFTYETRPDLIPFILDGTNGSISNRLSNIKTKTGSTTYREYQLQYTNTDNFSRLSTVTEKNGRGETLKPVQLDWNPLPSFYQQCVTTTVNATNVSPAEPVAFSDQQFLSGDLNGDGIYDLISTFPIKTSTGPGSWSYNNCVYIYWGSLNSSGFPQFLTNSKYIISASFKIDGWTEQKGGCSPIDFNGDGIDEILIPNASINEYWKTIEFWFYNGTLNNSAFAYSLQYSSEMPAYATGDFNNDGKGDIIYIEKGQNGGQYPCEITGLNQGTTLYRASLNLTLSSKPEKIFVSDYNGDGLQDVLVFYSGGYKIFWNKGNGISTQTLTNSATYSGTNIGNSYMVRMGDFNGDGLADFIMNESGGYNSGNSSWYFAINNGNGTFTKNLACSIPVFDQTFTVKDNDKFNCEVFDFDNDGKSDVIITKAMYDKGHDISGSWGDYRETLTYWMRSTDSTLTQVGSARSTNENDAFSRLLVSGDFNGDGKVELMNYGYNCYNASSTTQTWRYYNNPNISASSGLLTSVTSGMGRTSNVSYGTLTKSNIYTKGTGATYPVIDVTLPLSVVNSSTFDNGSAGTINQTYTYKGAKVHLQGKGFLGFMVTTANNTTQGVTTENGITSLNTTWYAPSQTYTKITVDGDIATTTVDYTYVDKGSKKYFAYPASKTEKDLDGNTYSTSRQYNTTDGYLTDERTEYGNSSMYRKAELRNYIKAGGRYQPQLIKTIQKHADDSQEFSRQTSLTYDASKGYTLTKVENYGTTLVLTTEYLTYDSFGNLKASTVSGLGVPALTTYTDYDATNRFPAKVYTSPASIVSSFTYDTWGNTLTEKDETNTSNILTTTHVYDNWGKRSSTTTPDGRKTQYREGWNNDTQKKYFTLSMGDGQPWVKQWFDRAGRETVIETIGAKGLAVSVTKNYNSKGQNTSTENKQGSLTITDNFQYDARGRLTSQSSTGGQSNTYGYGNRQTTVTRNGQQYTKTYDAWGNLLSSTDPLSSVSCQYKSVGKPMQVTAGGALFTMDYDAAGNQNQLVDPNAGTISYTYDAAGRLKTQDDARSKHYEVVYDAQGRIDYSTLAGTRTEYDYGTMGYDLFMLTKMTTGSNYLEYHYDQYGRVQTEKHQINGAGLLEYGYTYNSDGLPETTTYPGGVQVSRTYDGAGKLETVSAGGQTVWALANATGLVTTANLGGTMNATTTLSQQGLLTELKTVKSSTVLRDLDYQFNPATGNLDYRTGMLAYQEKFDYDGLDRLISVKNNATGVETMGIGYADNGNITSKTGLGTYAYTGSRPHAITELDNTDGLIQSKGQHIAYTDFNKAVLLEDTLGTDAYRLDIAYGPDQQRCMSVLKKNGATTKTTVFGGDYEKITLNGVTRELYYIGAANGLAAVLVKQAGQTDKIYYTNTDHLGSILSLTDQAGNIVFAATYDAWGKQTISQNTIGFARGYTGHEHLSEFGLIDMNGRMYDALLGRFISTDNYVQMPDFSQNFNRYSYCLNNPLMYSDPTGEKWWHWLVGDVLTGGAISLHVAATTTTAAAMTTTFVTTTAISFTAANSTFQSMILPIMNTAQTFDYSAQGTKVFRNLLIDIFDQGDHIYEDDSWIFKDMLNPLKIDFGFFLQIPGWEDTQSILGNTFSHIRNLTGNVDNIELDWDRMTILVNDVNSKKNIYGNLTEWGMTLGPYINSQNMELNDDMYKHEAGHTIQSRILGPFYTQNVGLSSIMSATFGSEDYHAKCWYEVWASRLGGAPNHVKKFRNNSFWYWFPVYILPFFPN